MLVISVLCPAWQDALECELRDLALAMDGSVAVTLKRSRMHVDAVPMDASLRTHIEAAAEEQVPAAWQVVQLPGTN